MTQQQSLITDAMRALIGKEYPPVTAWGEVSKSEIRRFIQTVPDEDPIFYDEEYVKKTRFGGVVAPATLPPIMIGVRPPGTPDPVSALPDDAGGDSALEGTEQDIAARFPGLSDLIAMFPPDMRFFHGWDETTSYQLARPGDRITCKTKIVDVYEKAGRSGPLGFVVIDYTYVNQRGEVLSIVRHAEVLRKVRKEEKKP
ncbi:MAG: MaoC family dehydratase N-terminal domain-containing protein [Chloroflexi bacterium]|nr:MaoC family dehydratase N-terminal domain-containing protein [Chloroflexota bacterium]